ncbi:alpha-amylase family glycosyl hydrolase [Salipaludibacillus aurantiacus]|uniref:Alpha amylase, catalytic domain n=1 Tax=Salipaludibacillus aurantiacus TaxID=1601833 RepID=A0A1H9UQK5_9BACI|nr:alpha-amylase family glycosyl hydrolase [Salipaludibacillus aurantiacus]SES11676.1 Alpha amylase, catalytic domain [Salipaludibacillus aurantiacus]
MRQATITEKEKDLYFETGKLLITVDKQSGLLKSIEVKNRSKIDHISADGFIDIVLNGQEKRPLPRRMPYYVETELICRELKLDGYESCGTVAHPALKLYCSQGKWEVIWKLKADDELETVEIGFDLVNRTGQEQTVRKAVFHQTIQTPASDPGQTDVFLPGVQGSLPYYGLNDHAGKMWNFGEYSIGAAGLINRESDDVWLGWGLSFEERADQHVINHGTHIDFVQDFQFAGYVPDGGSLSFKGVYYMHADYEKLASERMQTWFKRHGVTPPDDRPDWLDTLVIFETHIGSAVFKDNYSYTPYEEVSELTADLDRISAMGFNAIQIMPKQPYPCYAVHDYFDLSISYGNKDELMTLVKEAHRLGIKVILDVLLHGVMDQQIIEKAEFEARTSGDTHRPELNQTVIDFAPYWKAGSPPVHDLVQKHPDWFVKDETGAITGIYTNAFDAANDEWQDYFLSALTFMIKELDIDGFRYDAPHWNSIPNWDRQIPYKAGQSAVGPISFFEKARTELRKLKEDLLFYTEPSTPLYRKNMDLNYNYDEHWIIQALMYDSSTITIGREKPSDKITAEEMSEWFDVRQRWLPENYRTAHHVDSHDSFWWYPPGKKWRREQFGIEETVLLTYLYLFIEGPFMMYVGGEHGIENELTKGIELKKTHPPFISGTCDFKGGTSSNPNIFLPVRKTRDHVTACIANCSSETQTVTISWKDSGLIEKQYPDGFHLKDLITGSLISDNLFNLTALDEKEWHLDPFQVIWLDFQL